MYISFNSKQFKYKHSSLQSFYSIKEDIKKSIIKKDFMLLYNGQIIDEKKTPFDYKIKENDIIELKLRSNGGTISRTLAIVLSVLLFVLIFLPILIIGILPFFSYLVSNVIIKGIKIFIDTVVDLLDVNNWISSFLLTFKRVILPVIQFVIEYSGIFVISYLVTFLSVYPLYYYRWRKTCDGYQCAYSLAYITAIIITCIYMLAELPMFFFWLGSIIGPEMLSHFFINAAKNTLNKKRKIFNYLGPFGSMEISFIDNMISMFESANKIKDIDAALLYNWNQTFYMTQVPPLNQTIQDWGLEDVVQYINFSVEQSEGKTTVAKPVIPASEGSTARLMKWFVDTYLYLSLNFVDYLDFCANSDYFLLDIDNEISYLDKISTQIRKVLANKKENLTQEINNKSTKTFKRIDEMIENLKKLKEEHNSRLLNITCMTGIVVNGVLTGIPAFIVFIVLFIIFFFIVPKFI